jgi:hypothetical protein
MMPCRRRAAQNVLVDMDAFARDGYVVIRGAQLGGRAAQSSG